MPKTSPKSKFLQIRLSETMQARYMKALAFRGFNKSEHLTAEIMKFVEAAEKQQQKDLQILKNHLDKL